MNSTEIAQLGGGLRRRSVGRCRRSRIRCGSGGTRCAARRCDWRTAGRDRSAAGARSAAIAGGAATGLLAAIAASIAAAPLLAALRLTAPLFAAVAGLDVRSAHCETDGGDDYCCQ